MDSCAFCDLLNEKNRAIFYEDALFVAMWSSLPAFPGHTLVMPKRHVRRFREMDDKEMRQIIFTVATTKTRIEQTDLKTVCANLEVISDKSKDLIARALEQLKTYNHKPPTAFNDGINDGPEAGQTVPHLHWHILPRWSASEGEIVHRFTTKAEEL